MDSKTKIEEFNRQAWDAFAEAGHRWTRPVDSQVIQKARNGHFQIVLTPTKPVPVSWFPDLKDCRTLCLASGGGQQGPVLAAAGAKVVVLDNSPEQLKQDQTVAERDGLDLQTEWGDMRDLTRFADSSFDFVFQPCSLSFVPDVQPVFNEVFRVLRAGGTYILGCCNPLYYIFDYRRLQEGELVVRHSIPYSDLEDLPADELAKFQEEGEPLCFGHSLDSLIGGQLSAGFQLIDLYEDGWGEGAEKRLDQYINTTFATRALKPE